MVPNRATHHIFFCIVFCFKWRISYPLVLEGGISNSVLLFWSPLHRKSSPALLWVFSFWYISTIEHFKLHVSFTYGECFLLLRVGWQNQSYTMTEIRDFIFPRFFLYCYKFPSKSHFPSRNNLLVYYGNN